ncbi:MAG: hypothetical protein PUH91_09005 [Prevotella sp.]|nr:hypothetical protein [Prevotella sp.]
MKKAYITPEIQIYDADAENLLAGTTQKPDVEGSGVPGFSDGEGSEEGSLAKPGDFFCDNFEYDFDF